MLCKAQPFLNLNKNFDLPSLIPLPCSPTRRSASSASSSGPRVWSAYGDANCCSVCAMSGLWCGLWDGPKFTISEPVPPHLCFLSPPTETSWRPSTSGEEGVSYLPLELFSTSQHFIPCIVREYGPILFHALLLLSFCSLPNQEASLSFQAFTTHGALTLRRVSMLLLGIVWRRSMEWKC